MQRNEGFRTIEGDLMVALYNAGYILEEHMKNPSMIHFQRASKTDKNVSAAGQVCAAKLPMDTLSVDKINSYLPDQIRILDVFRVTKKFNPKTSCNYRVYQYLLPTFSFSFEGSVTLEDCWRYRLSAETLTYVNELFRHYRGTHNFFNFTSRRAPDDKSCQRYIMSIECGSPFLLDGDREFAVITIQGQSFMLHQIRKMIGLVIAIVKGCATEAIFENVFKTERMDIPMAPGLGLLLDQVNYTHYNRRFCTDGSHQSIDWERYKRQIDEFKEGYIFKHIVKHEVEDNSMFEWMGNLSNHSYGKREGGSLSSSAAPSPANNSQPTTLEAVAGADSSFSAVEM
ncbi:tRNA pseudouridine synthase A [Taenia crassiceps]|uniref:tRNA pseudouridine synthase A n=1 Tax=Taenia crassiceps TaxID=6207 RepID=A0ABR4QTN2_9CEST